MNKINVHLTRGEFLYWVPYDLGLFNSEMISRAKENCEMNEMLKNHESILLSFCPEWTIPQLDKLLNLKTILAQL